MKLVIFDLDGTLFRTETVDIVSINRALVENGYKERDEQDILKLIGVTLEEACISLIDTNDKKIIDKLKRDIVRFEKKEVKKHGELYEGVIDVLLRLKELDFTLCICSNGNEEYIRQISEKFKFNKIFDEISFNSGTLTKSQRVGLIISKYNVEKFIMVGDRTSDIEAARENNGISIGVTYGFGKDEHLKADYVAMDIRDVETKVLKVFNQQQSVCYSS